jgi:hypothetical protein
MKKIFFLSTIILSGLLGCKNNEVPIPDFNAAADKSEYKINDKVTFTFSGNPYLITFYSGEEGKTYDFRNRYNADGAPQMKFTTFMQGGPQANSLSLLVSTDFNGTYNAENFALATWKDITAKATISTGADNTASGNVDLSEFMVAGKPAYISFKYAATVQPAISQPTWTIKNVAIDNKLADGTLLPVKTMGTFSWSNINVSNPARAWAFSTTQLQMVGVAANTGSANEAWLISQPVVLNQVQRDVGLAIKDFTSSVASYQYAYAKAGTYKAVFEATNTTVYGSKTEVKEVIITVK